MNILKYIYTLVVFCCFFLNIKPKLFDLSSYPIIKLNTFTVENLKLSLVTNSI